MLTPIEIAASTICPAVRATIAEKLIREKGYTQKAAAAKLGLTQQCISNYVVGCRATSKEVVEVSVVEDSLNEVVEAVYRGADEFTITMMISKICFDLMSNKALWAGLIKDKDGRCPICKSKDQTRCIMAESITS
jgi:predicted transcriptional regulator